MYRRSRPDRPNSDPQSRSDAFDAAGVNPHNESAPSGKSTSRAEPGARKKEWAPTRTWPAPPDRPESLRSVPYAPTISLASALTYESGKLSWLKSAAWRAMSVAASALPLAL